MNLEGSNTMEGGKSFGDLLGLSKDEEPWPGLEVLPIWICWIR